MSRHEDEKEFGPGFSEFQKNAGENLLLAFECAAAKKDGRSRRNAQCIQHRAEIPHRTRGVG